MLRAVRGKPSAAPPAGLNRGVGGQSSIRGATVKRSVMVCCGAITQPPYQSHMHLAVAGPRLPSPGVPTWTDLAARVHVEVRYTGKISEMPAAPETVAARAVVAVTRREPGAQAPVRAFTARDPAPIVVASAEGLKTSLN
jgi:hypothetical protein